MTSEVPGSSAISVPAAAQRMLSIAPIALSIFALLQSISQRRAKRVYRIDSLAAVRTRCTARSAALLEVLVDLEFDRV